VIVLAYTKPTGDQGNYNFLQGALNNPNYKPKNYYDWQYIVNQQVANPNYRNMYTGLAQARDAAGDRERASYQDSKGTLTANRTSDINSAVKRSIAAGLGGAGEGSGIGGYRSQEITDNYQPSFDSLKRRHSDNIADINTNYRSGVAKIDAKKEDRGLKVATEATKMMQADTKGFRDWQNSLSNTLQKYGSEQADLSYKQQQDAYKRQQDEFSNNLALQKFSWDKEQSMLPYQYPSANSLLPYNMGPTPYQQAQFSKSGGNDKSTAYAAAYQAILSNPAVISDPDFIQSFLAAGLTPSDYQALLGMTKDEGS